MIMKKIIFRFVGLAVMVLLSVEAFAETATPSKDYLLKKLSDADNSADSIEVLFDIYDIAPYDRRAEPLENLYAKVSEVGDYKSMEEVIVLMTSCYEKNDSMQTVLIDRVNSMPDSDDRKSLGIYVRVKTPHANFTRYLKKNGSRRCLRVWPPTAMPVIWTFMKRWKGCFIYAHISVMSRTAIF